MIPITSIDKINALLLKNGISGAELERSIGLSNSVYSQWNTGATKPSKKSLKKIADYFGIDVTELLDNPNADEDRQMLSAEIAIRTMLQDKKINPNLLTEIGFDKKSSLVLELFNVLAEHDQDEILAQLLEKAHRQVTQDSHE